MAHEQAFYGRLSSLSPVNENIVVTTGDFTNGSDQFTIADSFFAREGQTITYVDSQFTGTVTITNVVGSTITVDQTANANASSGQTIGLNTPSGTYLFESASFIDPQNIKTVEDITGSQDSEFNTGDTVYNLIGQAANNVGNAIVGRFHLYTVTEVVYRGETPPELSAFVEWGEDNTEASSGDKLLQTAGQDLPIVSLSVTNSMAPIYSTDLTDMISTPGADVAGYQIALNTVIDKFITSSIGGDSFPYTGSAIISGSLGVTGSATFLTDAGNTQDIFLIKGNTADNGTIRANSEGIFQLRWSGSSEPTAIEGGIYYSSSAFYIGT
jgi:hypothetical protein